MTVDLVSENSYPTPYANTSILPLLILSLMQQKHSPNTKKFTAENSTEYDFIIVGAGSAGSVVANRLSELPCVSVLLLEAGKAPPLLTDVPGLKGYFLDSDISWSYRTVPQQHTAKAMVNNQVAYPSGKTLGGTSILNSFLYERGNRGNYDSWAEQGADGWSYDDVLPYFKKAEDNQDLESLKDGHIYHGTGGPVTVSYLRDESEIKQPVLEAVQLLGYELVDPNGASQRGIAENQVTMRNGQRCSTAKAYLVPAENRKNLHIVANAFVQKVVIKDGRATGVLFEHDGGTFEVTAKREVIMSAGAVNSAQLLMLSGIGPRDHLEDLKITVNADLPVGKNFHDHCGIWTYFEIDQRIPNKNQKLKNTTNIQSYIDNRRGPLSSLLSDYAAFLTSPTNHHFESPDYQLFIEEAIAPPSNPSVGIQPDVIKKYFGPYENSTLCQCGSFALEPKSRGTVRLQSTNPYDSPLIDPNYLEDPEDMKSVVEGLKTCKKISTSEPLQKVGVKPFPEPFPGCEDVFGDDDSYFECQARMWTKPLYHPVGTAKMGRVDDPTTVVDSKLRVKGIDGLRVVDASIMPIIPSGNTNIPTIMVAEKASDIIKEDLLSDTQTTDC